MNKKIKNPYSNEYELDSNKHTYSIVFTPKNPNSNELNNEKPQFE